MCCHFIFHFCLGKTKQLQWAALMKMSACSNKKTNCLPLKDECLCRKLRKRTDEMHLSQTFDIRFSF